ncbi:hypothetical protein HDV00_004732 [Rhizophlyctis rosea]|nr:hypothetical protein HDV00_004732 [Rhizophlyctis rosea]
MSSDDGRKAFPFDIPVTPGQENTAFGKLAIRLQNYRPTVEEASVIRSGTRAVFYSGLIGSLGASYVGYRIARRYNLRPIPRVFSIGFGGMFGLYTGAILGATTAARKIMSMENSELVNIVKGALNEEAVRRGMEPKFPDVASNDPPSYDDFQSSNQTTPPAFHQPVRDPPPVGFGTTPSYGEPRRNYQIPSQTRPPPDSESTRWWDETPRPYGSGPDRKSSPPLQEPNPWASSSQDPDSWAVKQDNKAWGPDADPWAEERELHPYPFFARSD